jgi:hypothetical protein
VQDPRGMGGGPTGSHAGRRRHRRVRRRPLVPRRRGRARSGCRGAATSTSGSGICRISHPARPPGRARRGADPPLMAADREHRPAPPRRAEPARLPPLRRPGRLPAGAPRRAEGGRSAFPWAPLRCARPRRPRRARPARGRAEIGAPPRGDAAGHRDVAGHPYPRPLAAPPAIWRRGASRLLDYGRTPEATAPDGPPVLVVPSLINRAYMLDLLPERSLLRWLAAAGPASRAARLGEPGRRSAASTSPPTAPSGSCRARHLRGETGRPRRVLGYCMGGTLAPASPRARPRVAAPRDHRRALGLRAIGRHRGRPAGDVRARAPSASSGCSPLRPRPSARPRHRSSSISSRS